MMDPLSAALKIAGSGLAAQSARLRVVSENMANAQATGQGPGGAPYARKTISFVNELDRVSGAQLVRVQGVGVDPSPFPVEHDPGNPAAEWPTCAKPIAPMRPICKSCDKAAIFSQ